MFYDQYTEELHELLLSLDKQWGVDAYPAGIDWDEWEKRILQVKACLEEILGIALELYEMQDSYSTLSIVKYKEVNRGNSGSYYATVFEIGFSNYGNLALTGLSYPGATYSIEQMSAIKHCLGKEGFIGVDAAVLDIAYDGEFAYFKVSSHDGVTQEAWHNRFLGME